MVISPNSKDIEKRFGIDETPLQKIGKYLPFLISFLCISFIIALFVIANGRNGLTGFTFFGDDEFTITAAPTHINPILNSSCNRNTTVENLTTYNQSTADDFGPVKNVINWFVNWKSLMVLNMPFEVNHTPSFVTKDYSGYGNNGTVFEARWHRTLGFDGFGVYEFEDNDTYIEIDDNDSLDLTDSLSVEAWINGSQYVKPKYGGPSYGQGIIVSKEKDAYDLRLEFGYIKGYINHNLVSYYVGVHNLSWIHVVMTYDGSAQKLYIDGVLMDTRYPASPPNINTEKVIIGRGFDGFIDEVRIYRRELSQEQINVLYMNRPDIIVSQETVLDDVWQSCITPNDGDSDGTENCSQTLTIIEPGQLNVWDSTDSEPSYTYADVTFYADYAYGCDAAAGSGVYCILVENSTELLPQPVEMTFNSTSGLYEYTRTFFDSGIYMFNITCNGTSQGYPVLTDSSTFNVEERNITYYEFADSPSTTQFVTLDKPTEVYSAILETEWGKIEWDGPVNVLNQDFDSNVDISHNFIDVKIGNLHTSFRKAPNGTANLTFYNLPIRNPVIKRNGITCDSPECSSIEITPWTGIINITFRINHFTNFTIVPTTSLRIWDTTDSQTRYEYHDITFSADYKNSSSGDPIYGSGVYCNLSENSSGTWSTPVNMNYNNPPFYTFTKNFAVAGDFLFNITCDGTSEGYAKVSLTDYFNITHDAEPPNTSIWIESTNNNRSDGHVTCVANVTDNVREKNMTAYYTWYKNGVYYLDGTRLMDNATSAQLSTLIPSETIRGENWTCGVFANDWVNNETEKNITVTIRNALPRINTTFNGTPHIDYNLSCIADLYDYDGDNMTVYYTVTKKNSTHPHIVTLIDNGTIYNVTNELILVYTIQPYQTEYDDIWTCNVSAYDGSELSWVVDVANFREWTAYSSEEVAPDVTAFEPVAPIGLTTNFSINQILVDEGKPIESYYPAVLRNDYGLVRFLDAADYSKLNITRHVNISQNSFSVNISANMSRLNISTEITLYNLTFVYPSIRKNSTAQCDVCTFISYFIKPNYKKDLHFNVSHFDKYPISQFFAIEFGPDVSVFDDHTDFSINNYAITDIANVSDVFVVNNSAGKIQYLAPINATQLNMSSYLILKYRNAGLNTAIPEAASKLNKPANITLYKINMTYPIIMRNGEKCPDGVCSFIYYDSQPNLKFNVTGFEGTSISIYNVTEGAPNVSLFNGSSTKDFSRFGSAISDFDIENVSGVVLEKQGLGKIEFLEPLNVSAGSLDWNSYIDIAVNGNLGKYVHVDKTELPNLNKSAKITFYNLSLVEPIIRYRNSSGQLDICPESVCNIISYSSSPAACKTDGNCTLVFNVTDFRSEKYRAMENDTSPHFIEAISPQVWYENKNRTIYNISQYVFDPDNTTLIFSVITDCSQVAAFLDENTTNVLFVPQANWTGTCTAALTASDGEDSDSLNVTLILIANLPPIFINGPLTVSSWTEDTNQTIDLSYYFYDHDGDILEYGYTFLIGDEITISINQTSGIVEFVPDSNWYGQNIIKFSASDEKETIWTSPSTTLAVTSVNDVPVLIKNIPSEIQSYIQIPEDTNYTLNLSEYFDDVEDGKNLFYSLEEEKPYFIITFNQSTHTVLIVPDPNWNGYESFIIVANDADGGSAQSNEFVVYVTDVQDPIEFLNATVYLEWPEDTTISINISDWFFDSDNDSVYFYDALSAPSNIIVELNPFTGSANLTPVANFFGAEQINFSATDGTSTNSTIATINITNVDDLVYLDSPIPAQTWNEDTTNTLNISQYLIDLDREGLAYTLLITPSNMNVTINNSAGLIELIPDSNWYGNTTAKFNAEDPLGSEAESNEFILNVASVNDPPSFSASIPQQTWIKNENATINLNNYVDDVENDPLTFTSTSGDNIVVEITSGTAKLIPDTDWYGSSWVVFGANDGTNTTYSNNITLTVTQAPSILVNTLVDGVLYNGSYANLSGIIVSNLTDSVIENSTLNRCLVEDSGISDSVFEECSIFSSSSENYIGTNCILNSSTINSTSQHNITGSNITGNSNIDNSNITNSHAENSNITNSDGDNCRIIDSYIIDSQFEDCLILGGTIYDGTITFNSTTYNASFHGPKDLTDIINYPPAASFTSVSSAEPGENITFTSTSYDLNIPGSLGDNITYYWDLGDGTNSTAQNLTHKYSSANTYTVTLTVEDSFGEIDTASKTITISTPAPSAPSRRGGGGRAAPACTEVWNCTEWEDCTPYGIQYRTCTDINNCGTFNFKPSEDGPCEYVPTCSDFVLNQDETAVDCGGTVCSPCVDGKICFTDDDCVNDCIDGTCAVPPTPPVTFRPPPPPRLPPPPPIEERPTFVGLLQKEFLGVSIFAYLLAAIVTILFVFGGIMVGKRREKKISEVPTYSWLDSLRAAIKRDIVRGVPEKSIRNSLLNTGWPTYIVDRTMGEINKAMLAVPVEKDLAKGYDEIKLKKAMISTGWPKETVDEVIEDVNLSILRKAVEYNFGKGFKLDEIGENLIQKGWPEDMVNKVADEFRLLK